MHFHADVCMRRVVALFVVLGGLFLKVWQNRKVRDLSVDKDHLADVVEDQYTAEVEMTHKPSAHLHSGLSKKEVCVCVCVCVCACEHDCHRRA